MGQSNRQCYANVREAIIHRTYGRARKRPVSDTGHAAVMLAVEKVAVMITAPRAVVPRRLAERPQRQANIQVVPPHHVPEGSDHDPPRVTCSRSVVAVGAPGHSMNGPVRHLAIQQSRARRFS